MNEAATTIQCQPVSPNDPNVVKRLKKFVARLWPTIDLNGDGTLDASEFSHFVRSVIGDNTIKEKDIQKFLNYVDKDGNGNIDQEELVTFMLHGLALGTQDIYI